MMTHSFCVIVCLMLITAVSAYPGVILYTIGPDSGLWGPSGFYAVPTAGTATWLADLGDGSLGINGGLAYDASASLFYAIGNDSFGYSSLVSFSASGASFTIGPGLSDNFVGGLAYNTADHSLYGIANDFAGNSTLHRIGLSGSLTLVGGLGTGYYGGLTYSPSTGLLYGFSSDSGGVQREFQAIDPATGAATWLFELGDGSVAFNGGVAYSAADGVFYVISNSAAGSALQTLDLSGTLTQVGVPGDGFWNMGLAIGEDESGGTIPEPAMWQLVAAGLLSARLLNLRKRA